MLWIEATDSHDEDVSARWSDVTDEQMDRIMAYAESVLGKPDTLA